MFQYRGKTELINGTMAGGLVGGVIGVRGKQYYVVRKQQNLAICWKIDVKFSDTWAIIVFYNLKPDLY